MYAIRSYYAIHIDPAGANISCDSCHGAGSVNGGNFSGHLNGSVDYDAASCDSCHGVEAGEGGSPVWTTVKASQNLHCETCHTGSQTTSYTDASSNGRTAPNKAVATVSGHNLASGKYADGLGGAT